MVESPPELSERDAEACQDQPAEGYGATLASRRRSAAAYKLRGHMDAAEYKHVVLGLIFLAHLRRLR
jgi:type I restriction enzyme M protein